MLPPLRSSMVFTGASCQSAMVCAMASIGADPVELGGLEAHAAFGSSISDRMIACESRILVPSCGPGP